MAQTGSIPESERSPEEGNGEPTPVFLPGEFHGQRSLGPSTQVSNPRLLHWQADSLPLSHQGRSWDQACESMGIWFRKLSEKMAEE